MLARERPQGRPVNVIPRGAAHAPIKPDRRLLRDRALAGLGVAAVEIAAQQRLEMRGLELFDQRPLVGDYRGDVGKLCGRGQDFLERRVDGRRDGGPSLPHHLSGVRVDAEMALTRFKSFAKSEFHRGAPL